MIELKDVSKVFSGKTSFTALANINLTIEKGDMVSIVGPSGSGKSTLLNLVGTLDHPSTGEIHIEGQLLSRLTDDELNTKFVACAQRSLAPAAAARVLDALRAIEATPNIAELTQLCLLVDR